MQTTEYNKHIQLVNGLCAQAPFHNASRNLILQQYIAMGTHVLYDLRLAKFNPQHIARNRLETF